MNRITWNVARFRFRATFRRRRSGYLALVLLVALLGGLAMGSVAAARRTQSSYPQYLAATHTSQLSGVSAQYIPGIFVKDGYNAATIAKITSLPHVSFIDSAVGLDAFPIDPSGAIRNIQTDFTLTFVGVLGHGYSHDQVSVLAGHLPALRDAHAFLADSVAARKLHLHVGSALTFGVYSNREEQSPQFGRASVRPVATFTARLAAIIVSPTDLVQDDVDRSSGNIAFLPVVTRRFLGCCSDFTETSIGVSGGPANVAAVQREVQGLAPKGGGPFVLTSSIVAKTQRAIRPESIAIAAFGAIVGLAALLIASQLIGRQLRSGAGEAATIRALGGDPAMTAADGLLGVAGSILLGVVLAAVVAIAVSPLAPFGPVRPFDPTPGVSFDWTVLGLGVLALAIALAGVAAALARRYSPSRVLFRAETASERNSRALAAISTGLPAPALVGVRFAVEPGRGADPVPVRSVILGSVLALIIVMATVIFGASLNSLVSNPPLYGWNWNYELTSQFGSGEISPGQAARLLHGDHAVSSWSGAVFAVPTIDGQVVPVVGERPGAPVAPPLLTGHGLDGPHQIVLGATTLAALHKHLGQFVTVRYALPSTVRQVAPTTLRIVGTATMPTVGQGTSVHLEMGSGGLVPTATIPSILRQSPGASVPGPDAIFVRLGPSTDPAHALGRLKRIAGALANSANDGVVVDAVQRPAEIVNYRTLGDTPAVLGAALAAGTVFGLGLTLLASVRRRRRELALLKTLGFTSRQLGAVVACQATVAVAIGAVIGIPLGIVAGRYLWDLFANEIHAVPAPAVAAWVVALIALGALVLGNLVSLVPGRIAARTPAGVVLSAD